jgi:cobalamin biosynthesis Co2+ chelatase CbiK
MARGFDHPETEEVFEKLERVLAERFGGRAYIATLSGRRNLTTVLMDMRRHGRQGRVVVAPFSFILGDMGYHMCGGENSYEDRLSAQGYETDIIEDGLGIHDAFLRLYLKHLYEA